jgi:hypothetical protein
MSDGRFQREEERIRDLNILEARFRIRRPLSREKESVKKDFFDAQFRV